MLPHIGKLGIAGFTRAEKWIVLSSVYCTSRAHLSVTGWPVADYFPKATKKKLNNLWELRKRPSSRLYLTGAGEGHLSCCSVAVCTTGWIWVKLVARCQICKCPTSFSSSDFSQCGSFELPACHCSFSRVSTSRASHFFYLVPVASKASLLVPFSWTLFLLTEYVLQVSPCHDAKLNLRQRILCDCIELTGCSLVLAKETSTYIYI